MIWFNVNHILHHAKSFREMVEKVFCHHNNGVCIQDCIYGVTITTIITATTTTSSSNRPRAKNLFIVCDKNIARCEKKLFNLWNKNFLKFLLKALFNTLEAFNCFWKFLENSIKNFKLSSYDLGIGKRARNIEPYGRLLYFCLSNIRSSINSDCCRQRSHLPPCAFAGWLRSVRENELP